MSVVLTEKTAKQGTKEVRAYYPSGGVPRTPLEQRHGPHPKKDFLIWKTPPSRQLSGEKRQEFQLDVTERFYDDYLGARSTGDARNEVLTGVHKLGFNPELYRMNAYQGLAYDPSRPVPKSIDFNHLVRVETAREKERVRTQMRQRRLSDSMLHQRPGIDYTPYGSQVTYMEPLNLPPVGTGSQQYQMRPQSSMQKDLDDTLKPELVPEVEKWLSTANKKDQQAANTFLRTISSQGQRPDPATKASTHSSRVRSAVMTPSRQRQDKEIGEHYKQMERFSRDLPQPVYRMPGASIGRGGQRRLKRSHSDVSTKGSMFNAMRQQPAHFTVHPEWASEGAHKHI